MLADEQTGMSPLRILPAGDASIPEIPIVTGVIFRSWTEKFSGIQVADGVAGHFFHSFLKLRPNSGR
ncbi:MAG: hypothetical protein ACK5YE_08730, partial [Planctomyces sp.]